MKCMRCKKPGHGNSGDCPVPVSELPPDFANCPQCGSDTHGSRVDCPYTETPRADLLASLALRVLWAQTQLAKLTESGHGDTELARKCQRIPDIIRATVEKSKAENAEYAAKAGAR